MTHPDELETEWTQIHDLARNDLDQFGAFKQIMFTELFANQGEGESGSVYRKIQFAYKKRNGPDMVFVAMGYDEPRHAFPVSKKIAEIRDDYVDSEHFIFGEHQAGVDDGDGVSVFEHHHIKAYFTQTTEGDYF